MKHEHVRVAVCDAKPPGFVLADEGDATVEYEFAGRTRDGEFLVSRILPVKALEAQ